VRTRRRGNELESAVYESAMAELAATGYAGFTMDGVAARARCGKAVLYRRWPGKRELLLAALRAHIPPLPPARRDRSARQNLLAGLSSLADVLAGKTAYPALFVVVQLFHDAEMRTLYAESIVAQRTKVLDEIIAAGVSSGEIDPSAVTPFTTRTGPALIVQRILLTGTVPTRSELEQIVDSLIGRPGHPVADS
jgi:AcrR family transcriptional regulator